MPRLMHSCTHALHFVQTLQVCTVINSHHTILLIMVSKVFAAAEAKKRAAVEARKRVLPDSMMKDISSPMTRVPPPLPVIEL